MAKEPHTASQQISAPLVDRVVNQQHRLGECHVVKKQTKVRIRHHKRMQQDVEARNLQTQLPSTLQLNEVREITASLLSEVCHGVTIEPHLQPLTGEVMSHNTAVTEDGARLDVAMYGFWGGRFEKAFVDIRVFNPCAQSNRRSPSHLYTGDMSKKRSDIMRRGYGKWNELLSLHSSCQQLEDG